MARGRMNVDLAPGGAEFQPEVLTPPPSQHRLRNPDDAAVICRCPQCFGKPKKEK